MFLLIGAVIVFGCVFGGYALNGGHLFVLWQPFEYIIILGAAVGAYVIGNDGNVLKATMKQLPRILKGAKYKKTAYVELLVMLNAVFKLAKAKGAMALEAHVEKPEESPLFQQFPNFLKDHHTLEFFCDFFRMLIMGADNPHEMEALMDARIEAHHQEEHVVAHAVQTMADGMPALGIVAAVLGVIHTMGSITEPPEVLGHLIGGALVGTFFGVFFSYGLLAPIANSLKGIVEEDAKYMACIKGGIIAYMQGYAPIMAVESARMVLKSYNQPSFSDVEAAIEQAPSA